MNRPPDGFKSLMKERDFHWHKQALDVAAKYAHRHHGAPARYPCVVKSEYGDDPDGPYYYSHEFLYPVQQSAKCDHCGHETTTWALEE